MVIIDFCTYLGHWPPYALPHSDPAGLSQLMERSGIDMAFVSALDGLFALNAGEANARLAEQVAGYRHRLLPVGTLNPVLPTWHADLAEGCEHLGLAGFRLHPAYHAYSLDSQEAVAVAAAVGERGRPLFVAAFVDEERFQHPALRVPAVPVLQIAALLRAAPNTTIVINNLAPEEAIGLLETDGLPLDNLWLEINAMDKPGNGLPKLVQRFGTSRLVFGSQSPFLYPEAALALVLANGLSEPEGEAILARNWRRSPVLTEVVQGHRSTGRQAGAQARDRS